ncbi:MAG TPA: AraC family transcriptional regulator [Methylomusa anaerophila]|uniref:HTH-type transcriptional activator Btr n=1 Tax=Methylomusa anaerophila TaxID=1930071 RepID=A0A348AIM4_9FIRM|nr:AraC family transcriptional regulator [Methylomusa anaerophila]BBB90922.1 HTH-type transcriptional activator Btr [Methylomusa anaerophila]HML90675.1 AraC family transcriptional regulator [Methylomusa anaerophila]
MYVKNLFFHIHYCNCRQSNEYRKYQRKITRTLQHHELIFISGGSGSIIIEEKRYPVKKGMLFYISPDVLHSIETDIKEPMCFLSVHFSYAYVSFNDSKWAIRSEVKILPLQPAQELKDYYSIEDIFKKLVDSWIMKLPGYEFITRTSLQQLLIAIYRNKSRQNQNYSTSLKVEKVIEYMHQNINHKVTLPALAEKVQLSSFYLSKAFKEITGYCVIEYFNKIKIDKAKELIVEGDKKIKEVAQALGFTDEFYFSRIFKKIEGISPSKFYSKNVHGV